MTDDEFGKLYDRVEADLGVENLPRLVVTHCLLQLIEHAKLHPREEWGEEDRDVLWYHVPVQEPPYCGNPNSSDWPEADHGEFYGEPRLPEGYYTHWQRLPPLPKSAGG